MSKSTYAILGPDGQLQMMAPSIEDAVEDAYSSGAERVVIDAAGDDDEREENPRGGAATVDVAMRQLINPNTRRRLTISGAATSQSTEDLIAAGEALKDFYVPFEEIDKEGKVRWKDPARLRPGATLFKSGKRQGQVDPSARWRSLVSAMLGVNAKIAKREGHAHNVVVTGLNLVPYWMMTAMEQGLDLEEDEVWKRKLKGPNLCAGSTKACRHSCLVFSGQNWAADWSALAKFYKTKALFGNPDAFGTLLHRACANVANTDAASRRKGGKNRMHYMIRLNVISDIPWERVFPDLFSSLPPEFQFYDYTKIADRYAQPGFPSNYDLTFSASGRNLDAVTRALQQGQRVAGVIHIPEWELGAADRSVKKRKGLKIDPVYEEAQKKARHRLWASKLPKECMGYEVIDGDVNDVRAFDPAPSIIALRWKAPGGQAAGLRDSARALSRKTKFIVEVQDFCGTLMGPVTPSEQPDSGITDPITELRVANPTKFKLLRKGPAKQRELAVANRSASPDQIQALKARLMK